MSIQFPNTDWSKYLSSRSSDSPSAQVAVKEQFFRDYQPPLLKFVEIWLSGGDWRTSDAEDLVQEFITYFFDKGRIEAADPEKGKLRTFLTACLKNFLINEKAKDSAQKRGGDYELVSLEDDHQPDLNPIENDFTAVFDRYWAKRLLDLAMSDLQAEYKQKDKAHFFEELKEQIWTRGRAESTKQHAVKLELSPKEVTMLIFRMRRRWRELLTDRLAQTVADQNSFDDELEYFKTLLSANPSLITESDAKSQTE